MTEENDSSTSPADGFEFPKRKHTAKMKKAAAFPPYYDGNDTLKQQKSVEDYILFIEKTAVALERSKLYLDISHALSHHRLSSAPIQNIVALGVGAFTSTSSILQFSCLVCLSRDVPSSTSSWASSNMKIELYDPLMSNIEKEVASHYRFKVSRENLFGKYDTSKVGFTLFYMPHCPYGLYNNVIWKNWNALDTFLILGNSFESYHLRNIHTSNNDAKTTTGDDEADCVEILQAATFETRIWTNEHNNLCKKDGFPENLVGLESAFNELALMSYPVTKLDFIGTRAVLARMRPSEEAMDRAAAADSEMILPDHQSLVFKTADNINFGHELRRKHFQLMEGFTNLNHGSFGATPKCISEAQIKYKAQQEAHPDRFFRITSYSLIDRSRKKLAALINAPLSEVVLVENASDAVNSILRSYPFQQGDKILRLQTAYSMVTETIQWLGRTKGVVDVCVNIEYPVVDKEDIVEAVRNTLGMHREGSIKMSTFCHISSMPAMIEPIEDLTKICHEHGSKVMIDGAHAPGQVAIDVKAIDAEFYLGNCHKWLFCPKGSAFMHVKKSEQKADFPEPNVISSTGLRDFVGRYSYTGTRDYTAFASIYDGLKYSSYIGFEKMQRYNHTLAVDVGRRLARAWDTYLLVEDENMIGNMVNVVLPSTIAQDVKNMQETLDKEHNIYVVYKSTSDLTSTLVDTTDDGSDDNDNDIQKKAKSEIFYLRLSVQIYMEESDFDLLEELVPKLLKSPEQKALESSILQLEKELEEKRSKLKTLNSQSPGANLPKPPSPRLGGSSSRPPTPKASNYSNNFRNIDSDGPNNNRIKSPSASGGVNKDNDNIGGGLKLTVEVEAGDEDDFQAELAKEFQRQLSSPEIKGSRDGFDSDSDDSA